jgi:hypothetical protein
MGWSGLAWVRVSVGLVSVGLVCVRVSVGLAWVSVFFLKIEFIYMEFIEELKRIQINYTYGKVQDEPFFKQEEFTPLVTELINAITTYNKYSEALANFQDHTSFYEFDNDHPLLDHYSDEIVDAQITIDEIVNSIIGKITQITPILSTRSTYLASNILSS